MSDTPLEHIPLNNYLAVQLRSGEKAAQVVALFMFASKGFPLFRRLEVLDTMTIGLNTFVRMRTDNSNPVPILDKLYDEGRAVVHVLATGEYMARLPGGRTGKVSSLVMVTPPKPGQARLFRGTKVKLWMRQFE